MVCMAVVLFTLVTIYQYSSPCTPMTKPTFMQSLLNQPSQSYSYKQDMLRSTPTVRFPFFSKGPLHRRLSHRISTPIRGPIDNNKWLHHHLLLLHLNSGIHRPQLIVVDRATMNMKISNRQKIQILKTFFSPPTLHHVPLWHPVSYCFLLEGNLVEDR